MDDDTGGSSLNMGGSSLNMRENVAGLLCYAFGWVSGLVIYLLEKKSRFVRYHAVQSLVTFGILNLGILIFRRTPVIGGIVAAVGGIATFVAWVTGMIRAYQGQTFRFPFSGDVAKRLALKE